MHVIRNQLQPCISNARVFISFFLRQNNVWVWRPYSTSFSSSSMILWLMDRCSCSEQMMMTHIKGACSWHHHSPVQSRCFRRAENTHSYLKVLKLAACIYCRVTSYVCQHQECFCAPFHGFFKTGGRVSYFLLMSITQRQCWALKAFLY